MFVEESSNLDINVYKEKNQYYDTYEVEYVEFDNYEEDVTKDGITL